MENIPENIITRFAPWADFVSWTMCSEQKIPVEKRTGIFCKWRENPKDDIMKLSELIKWSEHFWWGGFGVILGEDNLLCCVDLDDCLNTNGEPKNKEIKEFLDVVKSFTEISTSGKALHVFFALNSPKKEFALKDSFCSGKVYVDRFIKLTGNIYEKYDYPIRILNDREFDIIKDKIGEIEYIPEQQKPLKMHYNKTENWKELLENAGIMCFPSQYTGKYRRGKLVLESLKIVCPNINAHTHLRTGDKSANLAVLCRYDDGTTSLSCNHNSCDGKKHPKLLQKLWDLVKKGNKIEKIEKSKEILRKMGLKI
jgi:hypothetical protein